MKKAKVPSIGTPLPLGATYKDGGAHFALISEHAKSVALLLIDRVSKKVTERYILDPKLHKTGHIWHCLVEKVQLPLLYAYAVDHREPLLDPYAKALDVSYRWKEPMTAYSLLQEETPFDWQGVMPPKIPSKDLIIYEMHVRGFTQHVSSHVKHKGTYLGLIEKIPHLLDLGVNAVELIPIFEFDETRHPKEELCNYWGYAPLHFFVPMHRYGVEDAIGECKTMIRELHRNGIEVILDVVFNHTGEEKENKNYASLAAIDPALYYILQGGEDTNFSGCGNTLNTNHPVTKQLIKDSLYYWAQEMRVDGFRFDLATVLNREMRGELVGLSGLVKDLSLDPLLADKKLIAEPWDAAGGYQLGGFFPEEKRWSEWNARYRDGIRGFIKGDSGVKGEFANMITGSSWIFPSRSPWASINFITAHDGFSLYDLVSYNQKHNENNSEENRDGNNHELSWNCGAEGPTQDKGIKHLRIRQIKNYLVALMISNGIPMLLMGDEYGHSKRGNNNTWCQDNELNWFLWDLLKKSSGLYRFLKMLIAYRKNYLGLSHEGFLTEEEITWHGLMPHDPNWADPRPILGCHFLFAKTFAFFNATAEEVMLKLPQPTQGQHWHLIVNTYAKSGEDIYLPEEAPRIESLSYKMAPYTAIVVRE